MLITKDTYEVTVEVNNEKIIRSTKAFDGAETAYVVSMEVFDKYNGATVNVVAVNKIK
jgi:hypothetical protein